MDKYRKIAMERLGRLLELAGEAFGEDRVLADRYVRLAWKIKTRYRLRIPRELKRKFCKKCLSFWRPGVTCRVRMRGGRVTTTCLKCGRVFRFPHPKKG